MKKKGSFTDILLLIIVPIIFFVVLFGVFIGIRELRNSIEPAFINNPTNQAAFNDTLVKQDDRAGSFMDFALILLLFGLFLILFIVSYVQGNNPVFYVVYSVILGVGLILSAIISFSFTKFVENPFISAYAVDFPMTSWAIKYLFVLFLVFAIANGVALYAKPEATQ